MTTPNELLKYGSTDGRTQGSGLLVDSAKHLSHLSRLTLQSGLSLSAHGIDMADTNLERVKEIEVEVLRAKRLILASEMPVAAPPPPAPQVFELPDDMVVENIQSQEAVTNNLSLPKILNAGYLFTDATGNVKGGPSLPAPPDLSKYVQCPVPGSNDAIPRFMNGVLAASTIKVDAGGNVSGLQNIDCFQLGVADTIQTDSLQSSSVNTKSLITDRVSWNNNQFHESSSLATLFVSNGAFQPIGMSGEGFYVCNLQFGEISIWLQIVVGKTKTIYRSSFGGVGGIKSTQLEEHESDNGFDFMLMNIADVGKISFGVEQKTGEFHIKSDQNELIATKIGIKKLSSAFK